MTIPAVNVVALGGVMGISIIPVTHGLGGVSATVAATPVPQGGGRSTLETWWYRSPWDDEDDPYERQLLWELGVPVTVFRPTVNFAQFEERVRKALEEEAIGDKATSMALEWMDRQDAMRSLRARRVKTAIAVAGGAYLTWKVLSGIGFL